ncbi:hypothetical protein I3760_02G041800 [Carya illinoinensis]|uniref:Uncharacterized protein n=1 Tax=Carya illinoinensis TaxID=32201 RepID=A0A8T1R994_CARIL|nr:uncharacterized protein LOC122299916 [Carya illinoinensis]KAG2720577.1 hypothetical protein I3760_02G041800 [Carya illinoinensis]KAG6663698.1 hypothetical protein CIPAW_02G041500 [Carya illinoinensis]
MAVSEARAAWQRAANRCLVQEDAKRAPKLACCQSASSTSKQVDNEPTNKVDGQDLPASGFMPKNPSFSKLPEHTRWWLQLQPSNGYQKGLTYEQLNVLEAEVETSRVGTANSTTKFDELDPEKGDTIHVYDGKNFESSLDKQYGLSAVHMNKAHEVRKLEVKAPCSMNAEEYLKLMDGSGKYEPVDMDPSHCPVFKQANEFCLDPESPWTGCCKTGPWWQITDKDELPFLVMKKSLDHIENCDLPPPQKVYVRRHPYACSGHIDNDDALSSSSNWKAQTSSISYRTHAQGCPDSGKTHGNKVDSSEEFSRCVSDKSFSSSTKHKDVTKMLLVSEGDPGKAQLMEALCHSQTRAREAEKAAKQAYAEKEHILKLFFRQASQLFAYRQWFQLLELEALCVQIKNNDQSISTLFPVVLPWMSYKGWRKRKSWQKATKGKRVKRGRVRHDIKRYAVAFALGMSLVGAGLFLGWTVGCMLPPPF